MNDFDHAEDFVNDVNDMRDTDRADYDEFLNSVDDEEYDDRDDRDEYDYGGEAMDGDFDSAMTSAGYGTDEDYGYYGDSDLGGEY